MSTIGVAETTAIPSRIIPTNIALKMLRSIKTITIIKSIKREGRKEYIVGEEIEIELIVKNGNYLIEDLEVEDTIPVFFQLKEINVQDSKVNISMGKFKILIRISKILPREEIKIDYTIIPITPGKHLIPSAACYHKGIVIGASEPIIISVKQP